jgi:DNA-binding SARP family transcriptional activator
LLWREWSIAALPDPERSAVLEALALNREGVVSCENLNRWVFIVPLGIRA